MLGAHHRGILKQALANGGVYCPATRGQCRSLGTLRGLGYFEKVEELWVLTRYGTSVARDITDRDAAKGRAR